MRLRDFYRLEPWQQRLYDPVARHHSLNPRRWYPGAACSICGEPIKRWHPFNWDHGKPMSAGGARGRKNKALAHVVCNTVKGDRYPFSLRTPQEREAARSLVRPQFYEQLVAVWTAGSSVDPPIG